MDVPRLQHKRVYEPRSASDGIRVLVDRLWPRGLSKETAGVDQWMPEISPSTGLRKRFHGHPELWEEFQELYFGELDANAEAVGRLVGEIERGPVTLLYAAKDTEHNNAVALREYLRQRYSL
jgi:uncharacterized protein YeaO (DUF488 family)